MVKSRIRLGIVQVPLFLISIYNRLVQSLYVCCTGIWACEFATAAHHPALKIQVSSTL
jgi:hypothetical protein